MTRVTRDGAASVRARLKQRADATGEDFNLTLTHYGLERLLYRLSISPHAGNYLLKGALLFGLWYDQPHRPTRDADLLGFGASDMTTAVAVFQDLCRIEVADGITFDPASVKSATIRKQAGYGGVRIDMRALLDGARIALQVDIGFGDAVSPAPVWIDYPVLLADLPAPRLRAYPKATVVAEKLHALCLLGMANTRMKDYFDLWVLLTEDALAPETLRGALHATFERRQLPLPTSLPVGLGDSFARDAVKQMQWVAFLKRNRLAPMELLDVVTAVRSALHQFGIW